MLSREERLSVSGGRGRRNKRGPASARRGPGRPGGSPLAYIAVIFTPREGRDNLCPERVIKRTAVLGSVADSIVNAFAPSHSSTFLPSGLRLGLFASGSLSIPFAFRFFSPGPRSALLRGSASRFRLPFRFYRGYRAKGSFIHRTTDATNDNIYGIGCIPNFFLRVINIPTIEGTTLVKVVAIVAMFRFILRI